MDCIAIQFLYCREEDLRVGNCIAIQQIVLQGCVVSWEELYCKRVKCIAIEVGWLLRKLYCNTV